MIRFLLLTLVPFAAPYAGWYLWKIFVAKPRIDPATGDQLPPEFGEAPRGKLLAAGVVSMLVVIGGFLLVHDHFKEEPYKAIDVREFEQREQRGGE